MYIQLQRGKEDYNERVNDLKELGRSLEYRSAIVHHERLIEVLGPTKTALETSSLITEIAKSFHGMGKYVAALEMLQVALKLLEHSHGDEQLQSAKITAIMSTVLLSQKQLKRALRMCKQSLEIQEAILGKDDIALASLIYLNGFILHRRGHYRKALQLFQRVLELYKTIFGEDHIKSAETIDAIGLSLLHLGKCQEALQYFRRELRITETAFGKDHIKTEKAIFNLGASYLFLGKRDEALEYYERAIYIYGKNLCESHEDECNRLQVLPQLTLANLCPTLSQFIQRHAHTEVDGKINPLVKNHIRSYKLLKKLRLACSGAGITGKLYRVITQLLPFGMKVYGKYNELGLIAIPGAFEFDEPLCM